MPKRDLEVGFFTESTPEADRLPMYKPLGDYVPQSSATTLYVQWESRDLAVYKDTFYYKLVGRFELYPSNFFEFEASVDFVDPCRIETVGVSNP